MKNNLKHWYGESTSFQSIGRNSTLLGEGEGTGQWWSGRSHTSRVTLLIHRATNMFIIPMRCHYGHRSHRVAAAAAAASIHSSAFIILRARRDIAKTISVILIILSGISIRCHARDIAIIFVDNDIKKINLFAGDVVETEPEMNPAAAIKHALERSRSPRSMYVPSRNAAVFRVPTGCRKIRSMIFIYIYADGCYDPEVTGNTRIYMAIRYQGDRAANSTCTGDFGAISRAEIWTRRCVPRSTTFTFSSKRGKVSCKYSESRSLARSPAQQDVQFMLFFHPWVQVAAVQWTMGNTRALDNVQLGQ